MLASVVPVNVSVSAESKVMPANPVGKTSYGQRSMGDQRRHSPERPRELEAGDGREDQKQASLITISEFNHDLGRAW